jgi:PAS domain S-box-containing protein
MLPGQAPHPDASTPPLPDCNAVLLKAQRRVLELVSRSAPLGEALKALCETIEEAFPRARCSVLLLKPAIGTLHHAAGPRIPKGYCEAIDGQHIGPSAGSCGTAAFLRRAVIVEDIATDPLWADYRAIALAHSLAACASIPIFDASENVLGTFAIYHRDPGPFGSVAIALLRDMSGLATLAIESDRRAVALRESEEKLRMTVDAAGVGLWSWDPGADVVTWEASLCAIFGLPPGSSPVGRDGFVARVHPDDRASTGAVVARGLAAGHWEDEYRIVRPDGAVRWVIATAKVMSRDNHDFVLGAVLDVTERRQRDEQLRQAQKLEAVGQLTAGIAHNFNNMLMGLLPNLQLAVRSAPAELKPILKSAESSAERAADLVRQLMTYAGRNRPATRSIEPIGTLVAQTVAFCRRTLDRRIAFDERYVPAARASVDPAALEQAILNLVINARDALDDAAIEAAQVKVDVELVQTGAPELAGRAGDYVRIRIGDNGIGMDAATRARIYEPFFTTKEVGRGTGLGLATTHAIVREHGGFMTCESTPGQGTTFALYLPHLPAIERVSGAEPLATDSARPSIAPSLVRGTETILVVDDEAPIRHIVSLILEGAGFKPLLAASGQEALALLEDRAVAADVALVLLDVSMPGISGADLRSRLRELAPQAHVVYFTGYAFEAADAEDAVLEKPLTERTLLETIRGVLDRRPGEARRT